MKNKFIAAVAALTLSATVAVAAPGGKGEGKRGHGTHGAQFAQKLNLTDSQKDQIKSIREESRRQNAAFFETMRQTRQELRAAKQANDTARVEALKATMASQREQMKAVREAEKARILALLTAEQRAEYEKLEAQKKERRGKGKGGRFGKRP